MTEETRPAPVSGRAYLRLVLLAAAIGIPAAVAAALLLAVVGEVQGWLWDDLPAAFDYSSPPWFLVIGLPAVGAAIVVVARRFLPGDGGHSPLGGLSTEPTAPRAVAGVVLATIGTLCFGAVLGPEMPVIAVGSAIGLAVDGLARLDRSGAAVLSTAGSFSAVSALFGGPLVAGMLLTEAGIGLGAKLVPALLPGFVAAAVGYLVFVGFGDWGGLDAVGLAVPDLPVYDGTHLGDLAVAVAVGVLTALALAVVRRTAHRIDGLRGRLGMPVLLIAGGLAVGLTAQVADWLGADSQDVLFSGQAAVPAVVAESSVAVILVILVAKALAYAVSLGSGFRGGPVFPAIFLGVAIASVAVAWLDVSPTLAIAVGTASGMVAQTRLIASSLLFAGLLVGLAGVDAIPAGVLAAAAAWITSVALDRRTAESAAVEPAA